VCCVPGTSIVLCVGMLKCLPVLDKISIELVLATGIEIKSIDQELNLH